SGVGGTESGGPPGNSSRAKRQKVSKGRKTIAPANKGKGPLFLSAYVVSIHRREQGLAPDAGASIHIREEASIDLELNTRKHM
ncbi:hypothetical protein GGI08_006091, partial [Coemansia sp. S2]